MGKGGRKRRRMRRRKLVERRSDGAEREEENMKCIGGEARGWRRHGVGEHRAFYKIVSISLSLCVAVF